MKTSCTALLACILVTVSSSAYQPEPQAPGDLVFRDSDHQIYGREGIDLTLAVSHPGHVGIYIGSRQVVEALATTDIIIAPVAGEVMVTPLDAQVGVHSFYEDWSDAGTYDGIEDHGHMGAKMHINLVNNPQADVLRANIVQLAMDQVGEGYDNDFSDQKGPGNDQWTCCGLTEKVYESCAGQSIIVPASYGDEAPYVGGLNITPEGYHFNILPGFYFENDVEFSQIPSTFVFGRFFPVANYIFFPYTQFLQPTLRDAFQQYIDYTAATFGVRTNWFGFTITGTSNLVVVVQACTNLANPIWSPVGTNTLTGGSSYFSDSQWANYRTRFYRLRSP